MAKKKMKSVMNPETGLYERKPIKPTPPISESARVKRKDPNKRAGFLEMMSKTEGRDIIPSALFGTLGSLGFGADDDVVTQPMEAKEKEMKKGGKVRGSGIAKKGIRKCKMR
jgi:hypothetical protein